MLLQRGLIFIFLITNFVNKFCLIICDEANEAVSSSSNNPFYDPSLTEILKQLSYNDNPIDTINELISKLPLHDSDSTRTLIKKFSKILNMYDPDSLRSDLIISSMIVLSGDNDGNTQFNKPNSDIFNSYKPPNVGLDNLGNDNTTSSKYLMDGDMLINKNSDIGESITKTLRNKLNSRKLRPKRKIKKEFYSSGTSSRWPIKTVPYEFDSKILSNPTFQNVILSAINHWRSSTCIKFEPYVAAKHKLTHKAKLVFTQVDSGCYSDVGYPDESVFAAFTSMAVTSVFLSTGCVYGQIVHEIGHAMGFYHEQSRGDRDDYVTIVWSNILDQLYNGNNFLSLASEIEPNNLGVQYDLSSIMHYEGTAFGINGSKTIVSKDANLEFLMGNRAGLSFYDAKLACIGYDCSENCINPPSCKNDGYLNGNCTCVCPDGISGTTCDLFTSKKSTAVRLDSLQLDCKFENGFCDWIQEKYKDEVDFLIVKGPTLTQYYRGNSGPLYDRFNNSNNSYIYFNTYYSKFPSETAILLSPQLYSDTNLLCLRFWYNMYSDNTGIIGNLTVYKTDSSNSEDLSLLWTRNGRQSQTKTEWLQTSIEIPISPSGSRIMFRAQRYFSYMGDIAIDDITVTPNSCSNAVISSIWNQWSSWSSCSSTCGNGISTRTRTCQQSTTSDCVGSSTETTICNLIDCVASTPQWSTWYSWTSCSTTCGVGIRTRYRVCNSVLSAVIDNSNCQGGSTSAWQSENCDNLVNCATTRSTVTTTTTTTVSITQSKAINGGWSEWGPWDNCSLCEVQSSYLVRTRTCNNPSPSNGGLNCVGQNYEIQSCYILPQCRVDGGWSIWNQWSSCSASCGIGVSTRNRTCTNPAPKYSGLACNGSSFESTTCNTNINCPINGGFGSWSTWSSCSATCGQGIRVRTRNCDNPAPAFNGQNCTGLWKDTSNCNNGNCSLPGVWNEWSPWSDCISSFCNTIGYIYRTRSCTRPDFNGCIGDIYQSLDCLKTCDQITSQILTTITTRMTSTTTKTTTSTTTATTTTTQTIKQTGICSTCNTWTSWTDCERGCGENYLKQSRYRNCDTSDILKGCQMIESQSCSLTCSFINPNNCLAKEDGVCIPKRDGQWSEWEAWTPCSASCNIGNRTRRRYCNQPEPLNGGLSCSGSSDETEICDAGPCGSCWSTWSDWSSCTTTCGFGWKVRSRKSKFLPCNGAGSEYDSCWTGPCIKVNLTEWTPWTVCTQNYCDSLNATRYRFRTCLNSNNFPNPNCNVKLVDKKSCSDNNSSCLASIATESTTTTTTKITTTFTLANLNESRNAISGWTEWSSWSSCCGDNQVRRRSRTCIGTCSGLTSESESCDLYCQFTQWSSCSVTCNPSLNLYAQGIQSRKKICSNEMCNDTLKTDCFAFAACPNNFQWSAWSAWGPCNSSCGINGWQNRTRNCLNVLNNQLVFNQFCVGDSIQYNQCNNFSCSQWSNWSEFSSCSVTCSYGFQRRVRTCPSQSCVGESSQIQVCYAGLCPIDGQWSSWSQWSTCTGACGQGIRERIRSCNNLAPQNGGQTCLGNSNERESCQMSFCSPIDGGWSNWGSWSICSATCNLGTQVRKRSCNNPAPQNGGQSCTGSDTESVLCRGTSCNSDFNCTFDLQYESTCQYSVVADSNYYWTTAFMSKNLNSGPWFDHTTGYGKFLYAQASTAQQTGYKARVQTNTLQSSSSGQCLTFWHNMYGLTMGTLNIKLVYNNYESIIFTKFGNQGNRWLKGYTYIPANIQYKLIFESVRGSGNASDMALDDVSVNSASACEVLSCDFESSDNCDYGDKTGQMLWQRSFNTNQQNIGSYSLNIDASRYSVGQRGYFNIPRQSFENTQTICLSFSYLMGGINNFGVLNIYVTKASSDSSPKYLVWSSTYMSNAGSLWQTDYVDIFSYDGFRTFDTYQITFEAIRGTSLTSSITIDNIKITKSFCYPLRMSNEINKNQLQMTNRKKRQNFVSAIQGCGGSYTLSATDSVIVNSPNYPLNYPLNTECAFIFNAQANRKLKIEILDLELENTRFNLCPDNLEIRYNGLGQTGIRLCGTLNTILTDNSIKQTSLSYTSRSNQAMLYFRSDWLVTKRGFKALITVI